MKDPLTRKSSLKKKAKSLDQYAQVVLVGFLTDNKGLDDAQKKALQTSAKGRNRKKICPGISFYNLYKSAHVYNFSLCIVTTFMKMFGKKYLGKAGKITF